MDTLIEVHSDNMDIYISEEDYNEDSNDGYDSNVQKIQQEQKKQNQEEPQQNPHQPIISVKELEDKVKAAMIKLQEIISNKKKEEDSLIKLMLQLMNMLIMELLKKSF